MTQAEENARATQYLADQATIVRKRRQFALGLLAPPEPRLRVRAAWAPLMPDTGSLVKTIRDATPPPIPPPPTQSGIVFHGDGPPPEDLTGPIGSHYLDDLTGDLYELQPDGP